MAISFLEFEEKDKFLFIKIIIPLLEKIEINKTQQLLNNEFLQMKKIFLILKNLQMKVLILILIILKNYLKNYNINIKVIFFSAQLY